MMLGLRLTPAGIIEMIPSLPIHSSVLIPLVAGLFLAALILRAQRLPRQQLPQNPGLTTRQARAARRYVQRSRTRRAAPPAAEHTETRGAQMTARNDVNNDGSRLSREKTGARIESSEAIEGVSAGGANAASTSAGFTIHWGRTLLALVGALALLGMLGTGLLAPFTAAVTWAAPALCAAVLVLSLISLQVTAAARRRSKRRARVEQAMAEAMNASPEVAAEVAQRQRSAAAAAAGLGIEPAGPGQLFDALSAAGGKGGPDSLINHDADGLPDSAERIFGDKKPTADPVFFDQSAAEPWELREVPAAKYMVAEKAERPEPEELEQPEPAPASSVKLKQPAAASPQQPSEQTGEQTTAKQQLNLDSVLARRRA